VLLSAVTDPSRTSFFLSEPFTVERGGAGAVAPTTGAPVEAGDSPSAAVFAVAPTAKVAAAPATAQFRAGKGTLRRAARRPTTAAFRVQARKSAVIPGSSDLSSSEETVPAQAPPPSPVGASLDSRKPQSMIPHLFALLLVGSALSAVIAIRLLGR
jgi:hypothetical protein